MVFNNTSENDSSNSIQVSKKWLSIGIPLLVVLLIALAIGGYFIWLELSYETEDAEQLVEEAMDYYQSALHHAQNAHDSVNNIVPLLVIEEGESEYMDRANLALVQNEMNSTKDSIIYLNLDLAEYNAKIEEAYDLKLKEEYITYLDSLAAVGDNLKSYLDTAHASFDTFDKLSISYGLSINFWERHYNSDLSYDPDVLLNQVYAAKKEYEEHIGVTQALVDSGVLDPVAMEVEVFWDRYLNKWIEFAEAYKANNYDGAIRVLDEMEAEYFGPEADAMFDRNSKAWDASWNAFFENLLADMEDAQEKCTDSEQEAEDYYKENFS